MSVDIPPDLESYVSKEISSGSYASPEELVGDALRLFRELRARQEQLRADVRVGIEQADRGLVRPLDIAALIDRCTRQLADEGITD